MRKPTLFRLYSTIFHRHLVRLPDKILWEETEFVLLIAFHTHKNINSTRRVCLCLSLTASCPAPAVVLSTQQVLNIYLLND